MNGHRFPITFLLLAAIAVGQARAESSEVCARLQAELTEISANTGSPASLRRYKDAIARQRDEILKVRSDLSRLGCSTGSFLVFGGRNTAICKKLSAAHTKMQANLGALERKRDSYEARGNLTARRRIAAAIRANDCDGRARVIEDAAIQGASDRARARSPGLVAVIGDSGGKVPDTLGRIVIEPHGSGQGNLRTLCVRTCDGFFFPISSTATSVDFARDERACKMMCPGTNAELYYHAVPGQESEEMVSVHTQEPYTALPNAFAYRSARNPMSQACSCNMSAFYQEMARREAILNGTASDAPPTIAAHPLPRPDPGEDPETLTKTEGGLSPADLAAVIASAGVERQLDTQRGRVRIVGPIFLPDQTTSLDLKAHTGRALR